VAEDKVIGVGLERFIREAAEIGQIGTPSAASLGVIDDKEDQLLRLDGFDRGGIPIGLPLDVAGEQRRAK
jgi:hypothetical protein